jgi:hypothetical protein
LGIFSRKFGKSAPAMPPAFDIAQNLLYQPDEVLRVRVPDVEALAGYMKRIDAAGTDYWARLPRGTGQSLTIVVAIKPGGQSRFWLDPSPGGVGVTLLEPFAKRLRGLPVPRVRIGPVAFAMHATLWGGLRGGGGWAFIPAEWQERCAGQQLLVPDGVLEIVWPDD